MQTEISPRAQRFIREQRERIAKTPLRTNDDGDPIHVDVIDLDIPGAPDAAAWCELTWVGDVGRRSVCSIMVLEAEPDGPVSDDDVVYSCGMFGAVTDFRTLVYRHGVRRWLETADGRAYHAAAQLAATDDTDAGPAYDPYRVEILGERDPNVAWRAA